MVTTEYSEAAVEVLGIIDTLEEEEKNKIPEKVIEFLENNKSKEYSPNIDYYDDVEKLQLKDKTRQILAGIYRDYLCNEEEKKEYINILRKNEIEYQNKLNETFKTDNMFKNKINHNQEEHKELVVKQSLFRRILNKIKCIFRKK